MTGSGSPSADITPEIAQAIFMWIRQYANGGLVQFRDFYLEADAHGTIGGALIELEDRYSLGQGELTEEYEMRLGSLAERRRRQADQELDFNAPMRDHDELVRDVPDSSKAAAFLYCLPKARAPHCARALCSQPTADPSP